MINLFGDVDVGRGSKLFVLMVILVYSIGIFFFIRVVIQILFDYFGSKKEDFVNNEEFRDLVGGLWF